MMRKRIARAFETDRCALQVSAVLTAVATPLLPEASKALQQSWKSLTQTEKIAFLLKSEYAKQTSV